MLQPRAFGGGFIRRFLNRLSGTIYMYAHLCGPAYKSADAVLCSTEQSRQSPVSFVQMFTQQWKIHTYSYVCMYVSYP